MMPAARAAPPPLAARLLLFAVAAPLLPTGAARGACHCGCCEVEVRRGQDSLEGSGRLECTYAEPGLRYASPFRAPAAACESLCLRPAADQVLTAVEAPDMDTQRFCFFECKPSRNITEGAGKEAPRRGAQRPDWRGAACEPLGLLEAQEVRDPSGNALPPMEQAHLVASFLPGGARGSASAAGGPASRQPGPTAERPEGERFGAALAALRAQGAQLAELAGRATEAAAEAAQAARRTEDAALSAGRAAVEDARRAAQRALRAESQARALRDRVRQEVRQEAFGMVPQVLRSVRREALAEAGRPARRQAISGSSAELAAARA
ncbi:unnamed protein product [Prorocentrum cordatum]|uniref:Uncharacterized protein n=1 Tax=Prorocentrum cordatum TaxID=2364126 RepID=A0ABN9TLK8_9DINO|nr:unnamed protein product [Polarella glacialis]